MYDAITTRSSQADIVVMCSAVADYTPAQYSEQKVKKCEGDMSIALSRTKDILKNLGENKREGQIVVGFSMETENLIENSQAKLQKKNVDMICANSISTDKTGFGVDTNKVTLIFKNHVEELPLCSKEEAADMILDQIIKL